MSIHLKRIIIDEFKILNGIKVELPNLESIMLIGPNEVGKSTFMQFINIALGSTDDIPPNAFGSGEVVIDKDGNEYLLNVTIKEGKSIVKIKGPDGMTDDRKATLRGLVGANEVDINEFINLSLTKAGQKQQVEQYEKRLDEETRKELGRLRANVDVRYKEREELGKDIKKLKGAVASHSLYNMSHNLDQFKPVDLTAILEQNKKASDHNAKVKSSEQLLNSLTEQEKEKGKEEQDIEDQIKALTAKLEKVKQERAALNARIGDASHWFEQNPLIDTSELQATINGANEANAKHAAAQELKGMIEKLEKYEAEYGEMTANIESQRQAIIDTIQNMPVPVDGLRYDENGLTYHGTPVTPQNLSTSQIAMLGLKMRYAENPDAPLLLKSTESWDDEKWEGVLEFAREHKLQIVGEYVQRGKKALEIELFKNESNPS